MAWLVTQGTQHPALAMLPRQCSDGGDFRAELAAHMPAGSWELELEWFAEEPSRYLQLKKKLEPAMHLDYNLVRWGICIVRSRSFEPPVQVRHRLGNLCLVALGDLGNHDRNRKNIDYLMTPDDMAWSFHAVRDIAVGEELFYSYGCKTSLDMLRTYGFIPENQDRCNWVYVKNLTLQIVQDNQIAFGKEPMSYERATEMIEQELSEYAQSTASPPLIRQLIDSNIRFLRLVLLTISNAQRDEL